MLLILLTIMMIMMMMYVCLFICLFVRSIIQKRMIPKCSNLVQGMTLGYTRNDMLLGLKGQRSRSQSQSILHTRTAIHRHSLDCVTSRLRLCGCLARASLTFARWRNQSLAWDRTL